MHKDSFVNHSSIADIRFSKKNKESIVDRYARSFTFKILQKFTGGQLTIVDSGTSYTFGSAGNTTDPASAPSASIIVNHQSAYRQLLLGGTNGAAEAYIEKAWSTPDLLAVVKVFSRNLHALQMANQGTSLFRRLASATINYLNSNTRKRSKKNIAAHYDLSNTFFSLFLDPTMMYSAAIYPSSRASLEEASKHKLAVLCNKLELKKTDHLLEIGTGWGGLAIYAATHFSCRVTTTTISRQQYEYAKNKIADLGLEKKIRVLFKDYRELRGQYDKVVSIEMIEAVGHKFYDTYFSKCNTLLKPKGLMVLQAITISDQRYHQAKNTLDFIKKYIFPGGCLPSNAVILQKVASKTDMQIIALEDITQHYARTLRDWRQAFQQNLDSVEKLGFPSAFARMWEYYLCYCEGGFRERIIGTAQYVIAKPGYRFSVDQGLPPQLLKNQLKNSLQPVDIGDFTVF